MILFSEMIKKFIYLLSALFLVAQPLLGINARTYDDALKKGKNRPVVFFCYGANIDRANERAYDEFIKQRKLQPFVRDCVFLQVPVYQLPDEKQKKEIERLMGKNRNMPGGIRSLPCLLLLDGDGNLRGSVQDHVEMKDPETAGKRLRELLDLYDEQEKLLKKALRAGSGRQAKLLAQALDVQLDVPSSRYMSGNGLNLKKDKIGLSERFKHDPLKLVQMLQDMSQTQANAFIRNMIANGCYSRRQRQELLAALSGHARRNGQSANRLRALYYEMRNIDPKSIYARYAEGAIDIWVLPKEKLQKEGGATK